MQNNTNNYNKRPQSLNENYKPGACYELHFTRTRKKTPNAIENEFVKIIRKGKKQTPYEVCS